MSLPLRVMLIVASVMTAFYIRRKIRKSQLQIADVLFWIFFAIAMILMSVFPEAVAWFTKIIGVQSPVNFVFLVVIFLLIVRCFSLSVKVSSLEAKLDNLVEDVSVDRAIKEESSDEKKTE